VSAGSASATDFVPASARVAAPAARRSDSALYPARPCGSPSPTTTTRPAFTVPDFGSLVTSSALPVAPIDASTVASLPTAAASIAFAPAVRTRPLGPEPTPITTASARTSAAEVLDSEIVATETSSARSRAGEAPSLIGAVRDSVAVHDREEPGV
jgi:hypothetical protein